MKNYKQLFVGGNMYVQCADMKQEVVNNVSVTFSCELVHTHIQCFSFNCNKNKKIKF